ncbi:recombinase family protein [Vibrio natriegens]|uniref:recombinase family protein n=1 Tax=Vibrio natriegens TaxID=691 RepID=UPI0027E3F832|nr:recombinase family protein [Vibrio parahaemolyticus]EKK9973581.1 recombinase family protein [Vibrio parahaemolyticus]WMN92967.1 recombinase family protein [Vibrio parahaemolyticus]
MKKFQSKAQVYSYRRFSSLEQEMGSSIQRQEEYAQEIAKEYGLEINKDLVMTDRGLSGFHAEHKTKGALGVFLRLVEDGKIKPGSVLIVESLDRLSREQPFEAQTTISALIKADITVITAADKKVLNKETVSKNPFETMIFSILESIRSHNESLRKQGFSVDFLHRQIKEHLNGNVADVAGAIPFWVSRKPTEHKKIKGGFELNDKAETVREILRLYESGNGLRQISRKLNQNGIKAPKGGDVWGVSTLSSILSNPSLCGRKEFELSYLEDGKEVKESHVLDSYFPALISEDEFDNLQAKRKRKASAGRGNRGENVHLLSDYGSKRSICSECGKSVTTQTQKQKNRSRRRLHCSKHKETEDCCKSIVQDYLEDAFLVSVARHIDHNLINQNEDSSAQISVEERLAEIDKELENALEMRLVVKDSKMKVKLESRYKELEAEKDSLSKKNGELKQYQISEDEIKAFIDRVEAARVFENTDDRRFIKSILELCIRKIKVHMKPLPLAVYGYDNLFDNTLVNVVDVEFYSNRKLSIFVSSDKDNSTLLFTRIDDEFADDARGSYTAGQLEFWNEHGFDALLEELGIEDTDSLADNAWFGRDLAETLAAMFVDEMFGDK